MDEQKLREQLHHAAETRLSGLEGDPWLTQRVLANAKGEVKVKKKISAGFVLVLVLALAAVTALAAALGGYFDGFAKLEDTYGEYEQWPGSAKVELVKLMLDSGVLSHADAAQWKDDLSAEAKESAADKILASYFSDMVYVDTYNAMVRELGPIESWPLEEKALYTSLLEQYGRQKADWPRFETPSSGDFMKTQAIARAKEALTAKFEVTEGELDNRSVETNFISTKIHGDFGDEPLWEIAFHDKASYGMAYLAVMTRNGEMLAIEAPATMPIRWGADMLSGAKIAVPQAHDATEEKAVENAKHALTEIIGVSSAEAEKAATKTYFLYHERYNIGMEPVWIIDLSFADGQASYKVLLGYDASFIDVVHAGKEFSKTRRPMALVDDELYPHGITNEQGLGFEEWSLEDKAAFSQKWIPFMEGYLKENPYYENYGSSLYRATRHVYGLPDKNGLSKEEAIAHARKAIAGAGADEATVNERPILGFYYDSTDANNPVWKIDFGTSPKQFGENWLYPFRAVINARTGETVEAYKVVDQKFPLY